MKLLAQTRDFLRLRVASQGLPVNRLGVDIKGHKFITGQNKYLYLYRDMVMRNSKSLAVSNCPWAYFGEKNNN